MIEAVTEETGKLFGDLWHRYGDRLFDESVELFARRFEANGFDLSWFPGKRCLDAGCGGGRYTLAMAALGAGEVVGCDVSSAGLQDARRRAAGVPGVRFDDASVLDLPTLTTHSTLSAVVACCTTPQIRNAGCPSWHVCSNQAARSICCFTGGAVCVGQR